MPNGDVSEYIESNPNVDRVALVGPPCCLSCSFGNSRNQITDVSRGICYLHSRDVVHREIKGVRSHPDSDFALLLTPRQSNVLVDAGGRARIADFGLAMVTTREGFTIGPFQREYSPRWTAPEVLSEQSSGKPADIFSFAMLMIEVSHAHSFACRSLVHLFCCHFALSRCSQGNLLSMIFRLSKLRRL